jgi:hypothetical protein
VYVIHPNWDGLRDHSPAPNAAYPTILTDILGAYRVPCFSQEGFFEHVSCLQLSRSSLYIVWDPLNLQSPTTPPAAGKYLRVPFSVLCHEFPSDIMGVVKTPISVDFFEKEGMDGEDEVAD